MNILGGCLVSVLMRFCGFGKTRKRSIINHYRDYDAQKADQGKLPVLATETLDNANILYFSLEKELVASY